MPLDCPNPKNGIASWGAGFASENWTVPSFPALPDETTFSYVSRAQLLSSSSNRNSVIAALFGGKVIAVHRPWHSGFGGLSQRLYGRVSTVALEKHSLITLFQTFSDSDKYLKAVERAMSWKTNAYQLLCGAQERRSQNTPYIRASPALCTACVEQDLKDFCFAYYRRQHQILASDYCAQHEKKLITSCSNCGNALSFERLPTLNCKNCGESYISDEASESATNQLAKVRLSQFIYSMLQGQLPSIPQSKRLGVLGERGKKVLQNRSSKLGEDLTRYVQAMYGDELLKRLRFFHNSQAPLGWPDLVLSGAAFVENPIANALLISVLWDSTNEYISEFKK